MKLPASLADIGLALLALYALRDRLAWGVAAAIAILLIPAVFDISAWWGQYESIYLLFALAAVVFALEDRNPLAAAALALALMTKPQALPFLVPFAAWFWARGGPRGFVTAAAVGAGVIVLVWLPFIPAGGPANYLKNLGEYQGDIFAILSLRAWNLWWLVQEAFAGGQFVADDNADPRAGHVPPRRLRADGAVRARGLPRGPARPAAADADPGSRGVDARRVLLPDLDARALRLRRAHLPDAAARRAADPRAGHRLRGRVHAQPAGRRPADARDRRAAAGVGRPRRRRVGRDDRDRDQLSVAADLAGSGPGAGMAPTTPAPGPGSA